MQLRSESLAADSWVARSGRSRDCPPRTALAAPRAGRRRTPRRGAPRSRRRSRPWPGWRGRRARPAIRRSRSDCGQQRGGGVVLHGAGREPVGDHERDVVRAGFEHARAFRAHPPAEVGSLQVDGPIGGGAAHRDRREVAELRRDRGEVDGRVHGVAGPGVGGLELQQPRGRHAVASSPEPDPGGGVAAQHRPRIHRCVTSLTSPPRLRSSAAFRLRLNGELAARSRCLQRVDQPGELRAAGGERADPPLVVEQAHAL